MHLICSWVYSEVFGVYLRVTRYIVVLRDVVMFPRFVLGILRLLVCSWIDCGVIAFSLV